MRRAAQLVFVILALAACGKKGGSSEGGSGAPGTSSAPAVPRHGGDQELRTLPAPELAAGSRADNIPDGPLVIIGEKSIIVEGRAMVVVDGGKVDPASMQAIANWADSFAKTPAAEASEAVLVQIDPKVPSSLATQVIAAFLPSTLRRFAFVVRTPDGPGTVRLAVPEAPPTRPAPTAPSVNPDDLPVGMVVTLTTGKVIVWSTSMLEGTLSAPRLTLTPPSDSAWLTHLRDTLADIARRRWEYRQRPDFQKEIIVMIDRDVASADLINVIAAVQKDAKGNPLFPDVRIASEEESRAMWAAKRIAPPTDEPKPLAPDDDRPSRAEAVALREEEIARYADLLTGESDTSGITGSLSARRPGADLDEQIANVREGGTQVAIGGGGARGTRGDGDPRVGVGRGPRIDEPGSADGAEMGSSVPAAPSGRIMVSAKNGGDDTTLTADVVLRKIQSAYMAGLKRCYKEALKRDPTVRGAATIAFAVNEAGRTLEAKVDAPTPEIDSCMEGMIANWRFPVPKDDDGEATETKFQFKLNLAPD